MVGESCTSKTFSIAYQAEPTPPSENPTLKAPSFTFIEKPFMVSGTTQGINQELLIMLQKGTWGIDWLARDEVLKSLRSDANGKFETTLQFTDIGLNKIYVAQKKEWLGIDWLKSDIKSPVKTIITLNYLITGFLIIIILFVGYKMYTKHGKKKKKGKR